LARKILEAPEFCGRSADAGQVFPPNDTIGRMSLRVCVLYNEDQRLAWGEEWDSIGVSSVREEVQAVGEACRELGWEAVPLPAPEEPYRLLGVLAAAQPDVVFNLVEALRGDARLEAGVAVLLAMTAIPYTGSPPLALALALEKPLAKMILAGHGVPVASGRVLERGDEPLEGLRFPLIVKPTREDASHGITCQSVVWDERGARARARYVIEKYAQPALAEELVEGREFTVPILGSTSLATALPLTEIDLSGLPSGHPKIQTYEAKWVEQSVVYKATTEMPARDVAPETADLLRTTALAAYRALGLRDYGTVDIRLDPQGAPVVLEVNPNPVMTPTTGLARAAARGGLEFPRLIDWIVQQACGRRRESLPSRQRSARMP
jgi:D-alanine-D-alanine ligase